MIVQTPGVYIKEKSLLPGSVAGVSTAIPAFIGITEIKPDNKTHRIKSMFEFQNLFGGAYDPNFRMDNGQAIPNKRYFLYDSLKTYFTNGGGPCHIVSVGTYDGVSIGDMATELATGIPRAGAIDEATLLLMPDMHFQYDDSTDLVSLNSADYSSLASSLINESAYRQDRFALLDYRSMDATMLDIRNWIVSSSSDLRYGAVYYPWLRETNGYKVSFDQLSGISTSGNELDAVVDINTDLQTLKTAYNGNIYDLNSLKSEYNDLASQNATKANLAALIKFLYDLIGNLDASTTIIDGQVDAYRNGLSFNTNFTENVKRLAWFRGELVDAAKTPANSDLLGSTPPSLSWDDTWVSLSIENSSTQTNYLTYSALEGDFADLGYPDPTGDNNAERITKTISDLNSGIYVDLNAIFAGIAGLFDAVLSRKKLLEDQLFAKNSHYADARIVVENYMKQLPSQGAVAGIYCKNDRERGVWKSPANIAVQGIEKPLVEVSNEEQDRLNVDATSGKSINVIRTFTGKGSLVWGARTLDGNSNEWRYISVRRFFNYAEESIKKAMNDFVFEPNNARTWVKIKAMVVSFLAEQWKAGALVGNKMDEAFFVRVGEDTTTETEILQGKINIQIGMAVARPAEFIILEFSHYTKA